MQFNYLITRQYKTLSAAVHCLLFLALLMAITLSPAQADTIKVGLYQNPPKVFRNKSGEPSGFFVEVLDAIAKQEQWQVKYIPCDWEQCLKMLERGEIDLMPDVAYSKERAKRFGFHHEEVLSNWSVLYATNPAQLKSFIDLDGKRIAVIADSIQYHRLIRQVEELAIKPRFIEFRSSAETMKAVSEGRADAALVNRLYGARHSERYELQPTHILIGSNQLYFATRKRSHQDLLTAIDINLSQLKSDQNSTYYQALDRWITSADKGRFPIWLLWAAESLALVAFILVIITFTLKHLVRKRTAELSTQNLALKQSEAMFHNLFHNSQDAMLLSQGDTLIDCNPAMLRMFRIPDMKTMLSLKRDDIFPPQQKNGENSAALAQEKIKVAFEQGHNHFEWIHRRMDGSTFPSEVTLVPMEVNNRLILQATIRDISERKKRELNLQQLNRALKTLSRVNHILIHSPNEKTFLQRTCRAIVEEGGYLLAWVGFAQQDTEHNVKPVAQYGFEDDYLDNLRISWDNNEYGQGPTGIAIRTGKASLARDIHNDPKFAPWRQQATQRNYASSIALPLSENGMVIGAINIYSAYPDAFDTDELQLLTQLADEIAFGITTQRIKHGLAAPPNSDTP